MILSERKGRVAANKVEGMIEKKKLLFCNTSVIFDPGKDHQ